jgi:hypothetical protein
VISGSRSEVVGEHATESLSPANRPTITGVTCIRDDQLIIEALVVAFTMIMAQKFTNTSPKRALTEHNHALKTRLLDGPHKPLRMGIQIRRVRR